MVIEVNVATQLSVEDLPIELISTGEIVDIRISDQLRLRVDRLGIGSLCRQCFHLANDGRSFDAPTKPLN